MTQPTSVNMTFDTSLVDLNPNASFSTTESDPSDFGAPHPITTTPRIQQTSLFEEQSQETPKPSQTISATMAAPPPKSSTPVQHISTQDAYDQWATVYDLDGNMLQSIDDVELSTLLPAFLKQAQDSNSTRAHSLLDLGCGTGRNTFKLLEHTRPSTNITGVDFSTGMLKIATSKVSQLDTAKQQHIRFFQCDCFPTVTNSSVSPLPTIPKFTPFNGIISTLVLEHIPLKPYFSTLHALLLPGGIALVTNMHAEMGSKSQAGFVNEQGIKVRGSSFAHTVEETIEAARNAGLEVLDVRERSVKREDLETGRVGSRGEKWIGVKVWYGMLLRRVV